jgi:hypothetical protein
MNNAVAFTLAVAATCATAMAAPPIPMPEGEITYIELGDRLSADFGSDGGIVFGNFNAPEGTLLSMEATVRKQLLDLSLLDANGDEIDLGTYVFEGDSAAEITNFPIPFSGNYTLVIEAAPPPFDSVSGSSGRLRAKTDGDLPLGIMLSPFSGVVTNTLTDDPVAGTFVMPGPYLLVTDAGGAYEGNIPSGEYEVVLEADYFVTWTETVLLFPTFPTALNVALAPIAPVVVETTFAGDAAPGGTAIASAEVIILDGSMLQGFMWSQIKGATATLVNEDTDTVLIECADAMAYKDKLFETLSEPPIRADQLPPHVPPPAGEFPGGIQDRFQVVGASPFALEETAMVELLVEVSTTSGVYDGHVDMHTDLPWNSAAGIQNVPVGTPVLLHGKSQATYDWTMNAPATSTATLLDATTQYPEFTPDVPGTYELLVTDLSGAGLVTIDVFAGHWRGVVTGQNADGRPLSDASCVGCHQAVGADKFTPWAQTGHAEIFSANLDTSTHYGPNCFGCHTVGFDPATFNGGFDDAVDYDDFLGSGLLNNPGDNWTAMLAQYPMAAKLANIQCENCHGPQDKDPGSFSDAHMGPEFRTSLSSDGCATCHGEPLRHGRFQQWQLSGHANYELAIDEAGSANCSRCHTANGFLAWVPVLLGDQPGDPTDNVTVTWTADQAHPQTCSTCHDPHDIGTSSGEPTDAKVRIMGTTPPLLAGFTAYGVGKGAVCMTCHNTRRGLRNDDNFFDFYGTPEAARAPHGGAQTDMLMGENAYLTDTGVRGNHSFVTDTCVVCHMEATPPPDDLSYNGSGTNHTFFASPEVCADCHGGFEASSIQAGVQETLDLLQEVIEESLIDYIAVQTGLGHMIDLNGVALITDVSQIEEIVFGSYHGRQSMTVTFVGGDVFGPFRMNDVTILDPMGTPLAAFYDFADPNLIKAGWNWNLVNNDGSLGVHNPTFTYKILAGSIQPLDPFAPVKLPSWMAQFAPDMGKQPMGSY